MPNRNSRILAIDPGTRAIGTAFFEDGLLLDYAVKPFLSGGSAIKLLAAIESYATRLLLEKRPHTLVLEKNSFHAIRQNALLMLAIYKLKAVARRSRVPVVELAPNTIRKLVCGDGNATKRDVVKILVGAYPELRVFVDPTRRWKQRFFMNIFDAIGAGRAYLLKSPQGHG